MIYLFCNFSCTIWGEKESLFQIAKNNIRLTHWHNNLWAQSAKNLVEGKSVVNFGMMLWVHWTPVVCLVIINFAFILRKVIRPIPKRSIKEKWTTKCATQNDHSSILIATTSKSYDKINVFSSGYIMLYYSNKVSFMKGSGDHKVWCLWRLKVPLNLQLHVKRIIPSPTAMVRVYKTRLHCYHWQVNILECCGIFWTIGCAILLHFTTCIGYLAFNFGIVWQGIILEIRKNPLEVSLRKKIIPSYYKFSEKVDYSYRFVLIK